MSRTACALALAALLPLSARAGAHRDAVMDVLNAYEVTASRADLDAIGEGVVAELMEIAVDRDVPASRRGRAISALQFYPTDEVRAFLEARLAEGEKPLYQRKALGALAAFGASAVPTVAPYLKDRDEQVRMAAARSLGRIGGSEARSALQSRRKKEKVDAVREVIDAALQEVSP